MTNRIREFEEKEKERRVSPIEQTSTQVQYLRPTQYPPKTQVTQRREAEKHELPVSGKSQNT